MILFLLSRCCTNTFSSLCLLRFSPLQQRSSTSSTPFCRPSDGNLSRSLLPAAPFETINQKKNWFLFLYIKLWHVWRADDDEDCQHLVWEEEEVWQLSFIQLTEAWCERTVEGSLHSSTSTDTTTDSHSEHIYGLYCCCFYFLLLKAATVASNNTLNC